MISSEVTVLFPFHKINNYLFESVDSLLKSSVKTKIVFIDDTVDQSTEVFDITGEKSKFWKILRTGGGQGYGEALRIGSLEIDSKYVALFNSDDLIAPQKFELQLKHLGRSDISLTGMQRINKNGANLHSLTYAPKGSIYSNLFLLLGSYGANATWLMRTEWWKEHSFFDSGECLDWRIALKNFESANISYIPQKLYFYRKHAQQVTAKKDIDSAKMRSVFEAWSSFAALKAMPVCSYETFTALSTPWNAKSIVDFTEFENFCSALLKESEVLPQELYIDLKNIVSRRYIMLLVNQRLSLNSLNYLHKGQRQIVPIISDLAANFIREHVVN